MNIKGYILNPDFIHLHFPGESVHLHPICIMGPTIGTHVTSEQVYNHILVSLVPIRS